MCVCARAHERISLVNLSFLLKEALEIRSYLHDRALLQYGNKLEATGKCLPELLSLSRADLSSQLEMKRGHIARFLDRTSACATDPPPVSHSPLTTRRNSMASKNNSIYRKDLSSLNSGKLKSMTRTPGSNSSYNLPLEQSMASFKIKEGHVFKGIVAAIPADLTPCGCVQPPTIVKSVAPYSTIENISVQKLTPEYKIGMERLVKTKTPPMKSLELWREKPAIFLCIRRPGYGHMNTLLLFHARKMLKCLIASYGSKLNVSKQTKLATKVKRNLHKI